MTNEQINARENDRVEALRRYQILDTVPEAIFDRLSEIASLVCSTPFAYISFVDRERQWFKSKIGIEAIETPRKITFCNHAIQEANILEIQDARKDPRFKDSPLVLAGPRIRFYAGKPLIDPQGFAIGTLCVADKVPRTLTHEQKKILNLLGDQAMQLITKRYQTQLRNERINELQSFFSLSPDMQCIAHTSGHFLKVNPSWSLTLGYSSDELTSKSFFEFIHPDDIEKTREMLNCAKNQEEITDFVNRYRSKSGQWYFLSWHSLSMGEIIYAVARDVTETILQRKETEKALDLLEKSNQAALIGTWEIDLQTEKTTWSPMARLILETPLELDASFKKWIDFFDEGESREKVNRLFLDCVNKSIPFDEEFEITTLLRNNVWVRIIGVPEQENNKVVRVYGLIQNIDHIKWYESKLIEAREKARESDRLKTTFLSSVSHEIRTPLNAIIGFPQLILENKDCFSRDEIVEFATNILDAGNHLLSLLNDILDLSKVEANEIKITPTKVNLNELFEGIYNNFVPLLAQKSLTLKVTVDSKVSRAFLDPLRLKQILLNLISNSIKASQPGKSIYLSASLNQYYVRFSVRDEGKGIPEGDLSQIFEAFYQANTYSDAAIPGTGLGLSIIKKLVSLQQGEVSVESRLGQGTTFYVDLPFTYPPENVTTPPKPQLKKGETKRANPKAYRILVVEDDLISRSLIEKALTLAGFSVTSVETGEKGVALFNENFALAFIDGNLPGINGIETIAEIKRQRQNAGLPPYPMVALTADAGLDQSAKYLEAGFTAFETKPLVLANFAERVMGYINLDLQD